jgi:DNA-binding transcriptional LysR family regulator
MLLGDISTGKQSIYESAIANCDGSYSMKIDPKTLRLFIAVVEHGTLAAAAEREHIAPAAVSKRISNLEDVLGAKLLLRSNKGIEPTPAGMALLDSSRKLLHDLDALPAQMSDFARGLKGHVRILANISSITQFLPRQLNTFLAKNDRIQIHLEERVSSEVGRGVAENAADLGVLVCAAPVSGIEYHTYAQDELMLAVPADHPLARKKVVKYSQTLVHEYIGLHTGSQLNLQLMRAASDLGRSWICRMQVTSYDALCCMIEAGLGIGILPRQLATSYAKALRIVPVALNEPWASRAFSICCRPYRELSPAARLLLDHLLADRMPSGRSHEPD